MQWRVHTRPRLGERSINSLGPEDVRRFMSDLNRDGVGVASVDSVHRLLRRPLAVAVKDRRIAFNPASGIHAARAPRKEMRYLNAEEVRRLASEVPDRYEALILTLAYAGLRIGEAAALRTRNVDLMKRRIHVVEAASQVDGLRIVGETKTRQKRTVSIPPSYGMCSRRTWCRSQIRGTEMRSSSPRVMGRPSGNDRFARPFGERVNGPESNPSLGFMTFGTRQLRSLSLLAGHRN